MQFGNTMLGPLETRPRPGGKARIFSGASRLIKFMGPAFVVSVAYVDPGNFATNISSGSHFGYSLLWVILAGNLMAIFLQVMSAKLGIATGKNLPQACRDVFSKGTNVFLFAVAAASSMATTMAEFVGGALGFAMLFGMPLQHAVALTAGATFAIAALQRYGQRLVEIVITMFIAVICGCYVVELFLAKPDWELAAIGTIMPSMSGGRALLLAAGMLGATVMPHVIFLHSQLVQYRNGDKSDEQKRRHLRMEKTDIALAMNIAFIVNASMVIVSAAVFHQNGMRVESIEEAHRSLEPLLGPLSSGAFGVALLASGFSSSAVGAMAGETVMDGFVGFRAPPLLRRAVTMAPGAAVLLAGIDPMRSLVLSQVSLSFALPAAIIPLLLLTGKREVMGGLANSAWVKALGALVAALVIALNAALLFMTFAGKA